jgi:hypothetical protein
MVRLRAVMGLAFTPASVDNRQLVYRSWNLAATKTENVINPTPLFSKVRGSNLNSGNGQIFFFYSKILRVTQQGKELIFLHL